MDKPESNDVTTNVPSNEVTPEAGIVARMRNRVKGFANKILGVSKDVKTGAPQVSAPTLLKGKSVELLRGKPPVQLVGKSPTLIIPPSPVQIFGEKPKMVSNPGPAKRVPDPGPATLLKAPQVELLNNKPQFKVIDGGKA